MQFPLASDENKAVKMANHIQTFYTDQFSLKNFTKHKK